MVSHSEFRSTPNHDRSATLMQVDAEIAQLRRQVASLEQENQALWADLQACQRSQSAQTQVAELERAYAVLREEGERERENGERELAIAKEQEKAARSRAAELAKANEALKQTLDVLATEADLEKFLGKALSVLVEQMEGDSGGFWFIDEAQDLCWLFLDYDEGQINVQGELHQDGAIPRKPVNEKDRQDRLRFQRDKKPILYNDIANDPGIAPSRDYLLSKGIQSVLCVPLVLGNEAIGTFSIRSTKKLTYTPEQLELAEALAQQATLAVQLTRLAKEAEQAAIAREQEKAAQERAAELARANIALRQSIDALTTQPSIKAFLSVTLKAIAEVLEVPSACLWKNDDEFTYLQLVYQDKQILPAQQTNHVNASKPTRFTPNAYDAAGKLRTKPFYYQVDDPASQLTDEWRLMFQQLGVRCFLVAPIIIGDRVVGSIIARLTYEMPDPSPARLELVNALANQAALALKMSQLAEEAKQAAISREQKKAAQERAAQLAKANTVLRRSLDALLTQPNVDIFVGQILLAILEEVEATSGTIWLHDLTRNVGRLHLVCENGRVIPAAQSNHPDRGREQPLRERSHYLEYEQGRCYIYRIEPKFPFDDDHISYLRNVGAQALLCVPMMLGEEPIGSFTVRLPEMIELTQERRELIESLANQATLALKLTQLAEEAKQAAIAREQEKAAQERAAKLAQANEVLRASAESLTSTEDLDSFLGHVLLAITKQLGARSSTVWLNNWAEGLSYLQFIVKNGVLLPAAQSNHPNAHKPNPCIHKNAPMPGYPTAKALPHLTAIKDDPTHTDEQRQYFERLGVKALLVSPMLLNNEIIGYFTVRLEDDHPVIEEDLELIQALANQATLAVQLTRLAEEAKQAAIAREQEKAAQERAAELARANIALRQSIDALTTQPSINAFLGVTLRSIAEVLEVPSACLWKFEDEWAHLQLVYQDGSVIPAKQSNHPNARQPAPYDPSHVTWDFSGKYHTYPYFFYIDDPTWGYKDVYAEMFQQLGVRCLLTAPIVIGDRTVASITTRLTHDMPDPSPARLELVNALANQAALALQMADLAEEAKQSVILEERNRMAREIHDTLAQAFTGVIVQLEAAKRKIAPTQLEAIQTHFTRARNLAVAGLAEARRSVRALRPGALESNDLPAALQQLAEQMTDDTTAQITAQIEGEPRALPVEVETNLLRIGQEALTNALRHANAHTIQLRLLFEPTAVHLSIEDDGQGFDPQQQSADSGFGLIGMQERSERINGQLTLASAIGQGTAVEVTVLC